MPKLRYTFDQIINENINTDLLTNKELAQFHYFNPWGVCSKKRAMDDTLSDYVAAGAIKSGWIIAYGGLNRHHRKKIEHYASLKRVPGWNIRYHVQCMLDEIEKGYVKLGEVLAENMKEKEYMESERSQSEQIARKNGWIEAGIGFLVHPDCAGYFLDYNGYDKDDEKEDGIFFVIMQSGCSEVYDIVSDYKILRSRYLEDCQHANVDKADPENIFASDWCRDCNRPVNRKKFN